MNFSVIIENQRTVICGDDNLLRSDNHHLPVGRLAIRRSNGSLGHFQLELVCTIGGESNRSASYHRDDSFGSLCEGGRTCAQQVKLGRAHSQAQRSSDVGFHFVARIDRGADGNFAIRDLRILGLDDQPQRLLVGRKPRGTQQTRKQSRQAGSSNG